MTTVSEIRRKEVSVSALNILRSFRHGAGGCEQLRGVVTEVADSRILKGSTGVWPSRDPEILVH